MRTATSTIQYEDFLRALPRAQDKGKYIAAPCPFHNDNSPSLLIYRDGFFHCLAASCSRSGTWKTLWNKISGQPIQVHSERSILYKSPQGLWNFETREKLAYQAYINLTHIPSFQWYLEMRGLEDAIDIHELGYHRGWYTIPVRDREYQFQNVVFRAAPHVQEAIGMRYWADGQPTMFVPDWYLLGKEDYILVVFGMLDALTLNKFRYPVVTPTHGHVFKSEWLAGYRKPIYIIPDKGEERQVLRIIGEFGWRGKMVRLEYPEGLKDANDFLRTGRMDELQAQLSQVIR